METSFLGKYPKSFIHIIDAKRFSINYLIGFSIAIFSVSIVYFYLTRFTLSPDDINYVRYAGYIIHNNGQIPENDLNDLSQVYHSPIVGYPWGTALVLAFFNLLGFDMLTSFAIVSSLAVVGFYLIGIQLLRYFGVSNRIKFIFSILCIPVLVLFYYNHLSDSLSLLFYSLAILMAIGFLREEKFNIPFILLFSIVLFLPAFFRYAYYPLVYIIPVVIILLGILDKRKEKITSGILLTICLTILVSCNMLFEYLKTGRILFLNQNYGYTHEGLYWENLLLFDGFTIKSFFDYSKILDKLHLGSLAPIFFILSLLILALIVIYGVKRLKTRGQNFKIFFIVQVLFLIANVLLLIVLSLKEAPQPIDGFWTYVKETRYYAVSIAFILIMGFIILDDKTVKPIYKNGIALLLIISFFYSLTLLSKNVLSAYTNPNFLVRKEIYHTLKKYMRKSPDTHIIISCEQNLVNNIMSSIGAKRLVSPPNDISLETNYYARLLEKDTLYASGPVVLFVHLQEDEKATEFKEKFAPSKIQDLQEGGLYVLEINGEKHVAVTKGN